MSSFTEAQALLDAVQCDKCFGRGEIGDADLGDIHFNNTWVCKACRGSGFKDGVSSLKMELIKTMSSEE